MNPGLVTNYDEMHARVRSLSRNETENFCINNEETLKQKKLEVPCIIFLDSLKCHPKHDIASNIRQWLNYEWKKKGNEIGVFTDKSIKLVNPEGNGTWSTVWMISTPSYSASDYLLFLISFL
jgi:hypothetical protein